MRYTFIAVCSLAAALSVSVISCNSNNPVEQKVVHRVDNLDAHQFAINADKDTVLHGQGGALLHIRPGTFADSQGNIIHGPVSVVFKEAISRSDMALAGLSTMSDGKILKTGGMLYINAQAGGRNLKIAAGKSIGVSVPATSVDTAMRIFKGKEDSNGNINWVDPKPLVTDKPAPATVTTADTGNVSNIIKATGSMDNKDIDAIYEYADSATVSVNSAKVKKGKRVQITDGAGAENTYTPPVIKGVNTMSVDTKTAYLFTVDELGWTNIDRFWNDSRTAEIDMKVELEGKEKYKNVYTVIIIENSFISGYQKMDDTYCYSHGDNEKTSLPVGASATILFTCYKDDGSMFYGTKKIVIAPTQQISVSVKKTDIKQLEAALKSEM